MLPVSLSVLKKNIPEFLFSEKLSNTNRGGMCVNQLILVRICISVTISIFTWQRGPGLGGDSLNLKG